MVGIIFIVQKPIKYINHCIVFKIKLTGKVIMKKSMPISDNHMLLIISSRRSLKIHHFFCSLSFAFFFIQLSSVLFIMVGKKLFVSPKKGWFGKFFGLIKSFRSYRKTALANSSTNYRKREYTFRKII